MARDAVRTRDPRRRERILEAAVNLIGTNGYHGVSISDIGDAAGITGSGIYRHFDGKSAILVEIFDSVIDQLNADQAILVESQDPPRRKLESLIDRQVEFIVVQRELAKVYFTEVPNLPTDDQVRLRRKQRLYLEEWVHLMIEVHEQISDAEAKALVHASIGAIQSPVHYRSGMEAETLRDLLATAARSILGLRS